MTTPADRYAAFRDRKADPELAGFRALYDFDFDPFQVEACRALSAGHGVLVAAPTGSGKTVIGEYAVHLALAQGRKCFYTTPIKALSNQKYADLVRRYDSRTVGLLTGDNSINGDAPVVVMTTEVLRNMLYGGSATLAGLGYVVMDEVHYLADRARGAVWEEVIIHLPESVALISLSATVSNAEEFGEWLATVRGDTATIVEEKRPVPLYQHVMVGKRLLDLFVDTNGANAALIRSAAADCAAAISNLHPADKRGNFTRDRPIRSEYDFSGVTTGALVLGALQQSLPSAQFQQLAAQLSQVCPAASCSFGNGIADAGETSYLNIDEIASVSS